MAELLYASLAKLRQFPEGRLDTKRLSKLDAKVVSFEFSSEREREESTRVLQARIGVATQVISRQKTFQRWLQGDALAANTWFAFDSRLRWGRIGRNVSESTKERLRNTVFFGGPYPADDPKVDLLMGGWSGHLRENHGVFDRSGRIGSGLDEFFEIWDEVSRAEQDEQFTIPDKIRQVARRSDPNTPSSLESMFRTAYRTFDHALIHHPVVPLQGYARVLQTIPGNDHERPMVLASPLFVQLKD